MAGDWTCGNCSQPGCWNTRYSCYRCVAPRNFGQGVGGQISGGAQGMGGRYQAGVGSGMGGNRILGPTGRDQTFTSGGDPTQIRGPPKGGANKNKVGGVSGGGVGGGVGSLGVFSLGELEKGTRCRQMLWCRGEIKHCVL